MYCVSRVLDRQILNGRCHRHENCRVCSRTHSHDSVIFPYFLNSYFLSYGEEAHTEPCYWSEGCNNNVGGHCRKCQPQCK